MKSVDMVNHPPHYKAHPSGVECIQITEHMGFNLGNAVKYIWRADEKGAAIEDLKKAAWYVNREIQKRESEAQPRSAERAEGPKAQKSCPECGHFSFHLEGCTQRDMGSVGGVEGSQA